MDITFKPMTRELARQYFREFVLDPDLFIDPATYRPFVYNEHECDQRIERYQKLGRIYFAIMQGEKPIGEIVLKQIDPEKKCCTLGISLVNDQYKNRGLGTRAEQMILEYAFDSLGMETVFADAVITNHRSRHVLEKVGFIQISSDDTFVYYRCDKISRKNS